MMVVAEVLVLARLLPAEALTVNGKVEADGYYWRFRGRGII